MVASGTVFHIVVRREFAVTKGFGIIAELGDEIMTNPLAPYADSDLRVELEDRGYRVDPILF